MPSYTGWLRRDPASVAEVRAVLAWQRISDKPTSITVYRAGVPQTAQTVRVEFRRQVGDYIRRDAGEASVHDVILFGVADHPSEDDTDLAKGDRFTLSDGQYQVMDVIEVPGEVQATAERIS